LGAKPLLERGLGDDQVGVGAGCLCAGGVAAPTQPASVDLHLVLAASVCDGRPSAACL
jgi:hypothetical protein